MFFKLSATLAASIPSFLSHPENELAVTALESDRRRHQHQPSSQPSCIQSRALSQLSSHAPSVAPSSQPVAKQSFPSARPTLQPSEELGLEPDGIVLGDFPLDDDTSDQGGLIGGSLSAATFVSLMALSVWAWKRRQQRCVRSDAFDVEEDEESLDADEPAQREIRPQQSISTIDPEKSLSTIDEEDSAGVHLSSPDKSDSSNQQSPPGETTQTRRVRFSLPPQPIPWSSDDSDDGCVKETIQEPTAAVSETESGWPALLQFDFPILCTSHESQLYSVPTAKEDEQSWTGSTTSQTPMLDETPPSDVYTGPNSPPMSEKQFISVSLHGLSDGDDGSDEHLTEDRMVEI